MNKTEKKLVDAIKAGNYEKAKAAFGKYQELKSTTDIQANEYFSKVAELENVEEVKVEEKPVVEKVEEVKALPVEEKIIAPEVKPEKRGRKTVKVITKEDVDNKWNDFLMTLLNFKIQEVKARGTWMRWSVRTVKQFNLINKRRFR